MYIYIYIYIARVSCATVGRSLGRRTGCRRIYRLAGPLSNLEAAPTCIASGKNRRRIDKWAGVKGRPEKEGVQSRSPLIYIYRERERYTCIQYVYIYIYIHSILVTIIMSYHIILRCLPCTRRCATLSSQGGKLSSLPGSLICMCVYIYIYIYIIHTYNTYMRVCVYIYIYIYIHMSQGG